MPVAPRGKIPIVYESPGLDNRVSPKWSSQWNRPLCICHLEEVTMLAGHKVLMEIDNNSLLIVGDLQGILDQ